MVEMKVLPTPVVKTGIIDNSPLDEL